MALEIDQTGNIIFLREARDHSLLMKIDALLQILSASSVEDIAAVIGDHVYEGFFHSAFATEAGHSSQESLGSVPSTAPLPSSTRSFGFASG